MCNVRHHAGVRLGAVVDMALTGEQTQQSMDGRPTGTTTMVVSHGESSKRQNPAVGTTAIRRMDYHPPKANPGEVEGEDPGGV